MIDLSALIRIKCIHLGGGVQTWKQFLNNEFGCVKGMEREHSERMSLVPLDRGITTSGKCVCVCVRR